MAEASKYNFDHPESVLIIEENKGTVVGKYVKAQNLTEAAAEIQQLLDQLATTYPIATEADKANAVQDIQQKPALKGKIVNALEKGGKKAFEKLVDHPAAAIAPAVYEGFRESKK